MHRAIAAFSGRVFDIAIIGGGIMGACIARDAARRGLGVALIDKGDFSSGTSAASSKLVHGGLRYLKNLQIGLVRESLAERNVWLRIAPHLVRPLPFILPAPAGLGARLTLRAGLAAYDALARAGGGDLPSHRVVSAEQAEGLESVLEAGAPHGALVYYDAQMESPERLGLECLIDAHAHGAVVANYVACEGFLQAAGGALEGVLAKDAFSGEEVEIKARQIVNAAGPWADLVLQFLTTAPPPFAIRRAKGAHVVVKRRLGRHALALAHSGGHLFMIPWRDRTLIGTTDTDYHGSPDDVRPTRDEIEQMIGIADRALPAAAIAEDDIVFAYAGVRPLVSRKADASRSTYRASRAAEIIDHGDAGGPHNLLSVIGGKWTTARKVAQDTVDLLASRFSTPGRSCDTHVAPLPNAAGAGDTMQDRYYGDGAAKISALAGGDARLKTPLGKAALHSGAEILFAVREEMAVTLTDAVFRRTALAPLGAATDSALAECARIMGEALGWSAGRRAEEVAGVKRRLVFK